MHGERDGEVAGVDEPHQLSRSTDATDEGDPRTDQRIAFVGGIRGPAELMRLVDSGDFAVAFAMHPTSPVEVMDIADLGEVMPPKSTWFEPKLRSGLFVHPID